MWILKYTIRKPVYKTRLTDIEIRRVLFRSHILAIVKSAATNLECMYLFDYSFVQVYAQAWDC